MHTDGGLPDMTVRALVLGGGGIFGIAWELGMLTGLAEAGLDVVAEADVIVGTSAGSTVAAQVTSGTSLAELYERQLVPPDGELAAPFDAEKMQGVFLDAIRSGSTGQERRARIGKLALSTDTVPEAARIEVIRQRLPRHTWPEQDVRVVAVDAETGEPAFFDRSSGVTLVDAVAASCAVPGIWPAVTIDGRRFVDGGIRSTTNADLVAEADVVLILAPMPDMASVLDPEIGAAVEKVTSRSGTLLVGPDEASTAAAGNNPLDPASRAPSARAGLAQAATVLDAVRQLWSA
jgi:NTE family protein